jgi:ADP-heptose:LPS heptosyltransferase
MKKALSIRPASIGDCLFGKYFLENIHLAYPHAKLGIVVPGKSGMIKDLFAGESWLEVLEANRRSPSSIVKLWRQFGGSDIVLTHYTGSTVNIAIKVIGKLLAKRGGLAGFSDASSLNTFIFDKYLQTKPEIPTRLFEVQALEAFDIPVALAYPRLSFIKDEHALQKFSLTAPYIVVQLFSGSKSRGLSVEAMRRLLLALSKTLPHVTLVLAGGKGDIGEATEASKDIPKVRIISGAATLQELMNLIDKSVCVVSLDTGVGHIAAHMRKQAFILTSCIGEFGWWGKEQYGPDAPIETFIHHPPEHVHVSKFYPECLEKIDMESVANAVARKMR